MRKALFLDARPISADKLKWLRRRVLLSPLPIDKFPTQRFQQTSTNGLNATDIENLQRDLKALAEKKLDGATYEEKQNVISKLNVRIYPSEDLKIMRVKCGVNFISERDGDNIQCGKIIFAPPKGTIPRTGRTRNGYFPPTRVFSITFPWPQT